MAAEGSDHPHTLSAETILSLDGVHVYAIERAGPRRIRPFVIFDGWLAFATPPLRERDDEGARLVREPLSMEEPSAASLAGTRRDSQPV